MAESLPSVQRRITAATGTPTRLNRPDVAPVDPVAELAFSETPILITEQEVIFGTAAAVRAPSKRTAGQWITQLRPRHLFARSRADERAAKHRHHPHHYDFLEQALIAREMDRL